MEADQDSTHSSAPAFATIRKAVTRSNVFSPQSHQVDAGQLLQVFRVSQGSEWPGKKLFSGIAGQLGSSRVGELQHPVLGNADGFAGTLHDCAIVVFDFSDFGRAR